MQTSEEAKLHGLSENEFNNVIDLFKTLRKWRDEIRDSDSPKGTLSNHESTQTENKPIKDEKVA